MAVHIAILKRPYADAILRGAKTVESRMTRAAIPPYRAVHEGERLFIKVSSGPFVATARAAKAEFFGDLTPRDIRRLRQRFEPRVGGSDAYWGTKHASRFATFLTLAEVEPIDTGPAYPKSMRAWHVLGDEADPIREARLTQGAIRNGYLRLPRAGVGVPAEADTPVRLVMPDDTVITTEYARGLMLRWRGWRAWFQDHALAPGDIVRFVALGRGRYRVSFRKMNAKPHP